MFVEPKFQKNTDSAIHFKWYTKALAETVEYPSGKGEINENGLRRVLIGAAKDAHVRPDPSTFQEVIPCQDAVRSC